MFQLNSYSYKQHLVFVGRRFLRSVPLGWLNVRATFRAKKPLVFTSRVKRLIFTDLLLLGVLLALFNLLVSPELITITGIIICLLLAFLVQSPFIFLANSLNAPAEAAVRQYYIRDAKRILKQHPNLIIIGITGSYGKTSTKNYVAKLLSARYNVLMTPQSYNTPMGICMTIRTELRGYHDVFVVEMGAKKRGEIAEICRITQPDIGILTSIGPAHLETFGSLENTVKTKFELIRALSSSSKALRFAFINGDNDLLTSSLPEHLPDGVPAATFGTHSRNQIQAIPLQVDADGSTFELLSRNKFRTTDGAREVPVEVAGEAVTPSQGSAQSNPYSYKMPLVGAHNVVNVSVAIAVAQHLGVGEHLIASKLQRLSAPEHRLELKKKSRDLVILDDAYNSNPAGAKAALDVLEMMPGLKLVVTPGMVELGSAHIEANYNFGREIAKVADFVCLVGVKQTEPIQQGLQESNFDATRLAVVKTVEEGIAKALNIPAQPGETRFLLLENDLPDNYKE